MIDSADRIGMRPVMNEARPAVQLAWPYQSVNTLGRHLARLRVVREQIRAIEHERLHKFAAAPAGDKGPHAMVRLIARVCGVGIETADMLVNEVLSRHLRDRRAVARYAGLTGSPFSDKPLGRNSYRITTLAQDVLGLIDATGRQRAAVVGHDWGGAVAWWLATYNPDRVERVAVLNCPHPVVFPRVLKRTPAQLLRSWYMFFFQLPGLPEWMSSRASYAVLTRTLRSTARPGTFSDYDLEHYRAAWSQPGALTAMLNWYRAALPMLLGRTRPDVPVEVPALLLWGTRDAFLGRELVQPTLDLCNDARVVFLEEATH